MERKKFDKGIWLIIILIILVLGLVGYVIYNNLKDDNAKNNNNRETTQFETKDITLDFQKEKLDNVMEVDFGLMDSLTENKYKVNLTINNIEVNGKKHEVKIKNYEPNDYSCKQGVDKVVYLDNKIIYEPSDEACYLSGLYKIILFKNQYIVLHIGASIHIYDENGIEIKLEKDMIITTIDNTSDNSIIFTGWDDGDNGQVCKDNKYELKIENKVISYNLIKKGTKTYAWISIILHALINFYM